MGLPKLVKFVTDEPGSFDQDFILKDTPLVINGVELMFELLNWNFQDLQRRGLDTQVEVRYGGQYAEFYDRVCKFFCELQRNGVLPLVVFDGVKEKKKKFIVDARRQAKLESLSKLNGKSRNPWYPTLTKDVFLQALIKCNVAVVRAAFEGGPTIAAVARKYRCPVMANNRDFLIYDLPGGVVVLWKLDLQNPCQANQKAPILFRRSLFVSSLQKKMRDRNVPEEAIGKLAAVLPLAAVLSENKNVEHLYSAAKLEADPHPLVPALAWILGDLNLQDDDIVMSIALKRLDPDERKTICDNVKCSVEMYSPEESVAEALVSQCLGNGAEDTSGGAQAALRPSWLMELFRFGWFLRAFFSAGKLCVEPANLCVESIDHHPVRNVHAPLWANLLSLFDKTSMREEVRKPGQLVWHWVDVDCIPLQVDDKPVSMADVDSIGVAKRRECLLHALQSCTELVAKLPESWQIIIASLRYLWHRVYEDPKQPRIDKRHLMVLLVGTLDACLGSGGGAGDGLPDFPCLDSTFSDSMRHSLASWSDDVTNLDSAGNSAGSTAATSAGPAADEASAGATAEASAGATAEASAGSAATVAGPAEVEIPSPDMCVTDVHIFNAWQRVLFTTLQLNLALKLPFPVPCLHRIYDGVRNYERKQGDSDVFATVHRSNVVDSLWKAVDSHEADTPAATQSSGVHNRFAGLELED